MSAELTPAPALRLAIGAVSDALVGIYEGFPAHYVLERIETAHAFLENAEASIEALNPDVVRNP